MKKTLLALVLLFCWHVQAQLRYPLTKVVDSSDTYFGTVYKDPYRWLEHVNDPEVKEWFQQQAALANNVLNRLSGRDELVKEWKRLDLLRPPHYQIYDYENGRLFYKKTMPGENVGKVFYREGLDGAEQLLFDPATYLKGHTLSVQNVLPSYDGKMVIISYSESGAEISTIRVMDIASKQFLPETIYPSWFGPISWTFDNKAFTYFSQKTGDNTSPQFELNTKTRLHRIGDVVSNDVDFFSNESYPELGISANQLPFAGLNKDSRGHIFVNVANVRPELQYYFAPVSELNEKKIHWKVLCKPEDQLVRALDVIGDDVFAITYRNAKRYKLLHTNLQDPDWEHAETVMDEKDETLENIVHSRDYLYATYSNGINNRIFKYNLKTKKVSEVSLPFAGSAYIFCYDTKTNNCLVDITSWNKPVTEFSYDAERNAFAPSSFNQPPHYPGPYNELVAQEVEVQGHDGTMVPLSIVHRKDLKLDGNNVTLMDGYGAYGISATPYFSILMNALAVHGVVIAYPHVRGGSEKGEAWYRAGYKTTKPNTWKDFNSCAEYLIANGYTRPSKLAGTGTSAGGILISRAITDRPDLYAAAICNVGCANAMRMEATPNGPANIPEFGTVKDSVECRALYEMDGVQHVKPGTAYPAVICIAGWNDPRVIAWQPGKFAAALQNASASRKPVLMKVNFDNGHFTEDKSVVYSNFADQFAFVLWQCGHPEFQPKKAARPAVMKGGK